MKGVVRNLSQVYTSVKMVTSSPTMDMWISTIPFSVTLTSLHLLVVLILEETGLLQMELEYLVLMSQELPETEILTINGQWRSTRGNISLYRTKHYWSEPDCLCGVVQEWR